LNDVMNDTDTYNEHSSDSPTRYVNHLIFPSFSIKEDLCDLRDIACANAFNEGIRHLYLIGHKKHSISCIFISIKILTL
jgi:hypothetical protein